MASIEEQNQEIVANSHARRTWCQIDVLDSKNNDIKVTSFEGEIISGNLTIVSAQDGDLCRRSGQIEMVLSSSLSEDYYKVSLRNKVQMFIIIEDIMTGIKGTFNMGYYWMNNPQVKLQNNSEVITVSLVDLMSEFTSDYGSQIGHKLSIENGDTIANFLNNFVRNADLMNLTKVKIIEDTPLTIPYQLDFESDSTCSDVLKKILELYLGYEIFFDNEGIFTYRKIQDYSYDYPIEVYDNSPMIVDISETKSFSNVKNKVIIWGQTVESSDDTSTPYQYTYTSINDNPNNPLSTVNIPTKVFSKTDDKYQSEEQCKSASEYYLEQKSNYAEKISISIIPNPRLQPNTVIKVKYVDDNISIDGKYLIDSLSFDLKSEGLQTIEAHKLYEPKPIIIDGSNFNDIRSNIIYDGSSFTDDKKYRTLNGGEF